MMSELDKFAEYENDPTKEERSYWIKICLKKVENVKKVGKWLQFVGEEYVDNYFKKVATTFNKHLLPSIYAIKVSTKKQAMEKNGLNKLTYLICFYVEDSTDATLVESAAREIVENFSPKRGLSYKPDIFTNEGMDKTIYKFSLAKNKFSFSKEPDYEVFLKMVK